MCLELTAGMCGMLGRLRLSELTILVISRSFQRHPKNFIEPSESSFELGSLNINTARALNPKAQFFVAMVLRV
jgi:hypothetical protein